MTDAPKPRTCPFAGLGQSQATDQALLGRRSVLFGLGAAGGALGLSATSRATAQSTAPANSAAAEAQTRQEFYGRRQAGIVNPQPSAALVVAFDVLATSRSELQRLFKGLTERFAFLMHGGAAPRASEKMPPPDSGLLGPDIAPDNTTLTLAVGASLFDGRFGLEAERPKHLAAMTKFPNDALVADQCHGDLLLQICSNTAETNIHALRDILKHFPDLLAIRWKIDGFLPPNTVRSLGKDTARNLLGFKDGTANVDAQDGDLMDRLVWVGAHSDEPAWAQDGSYQVVRIVRTLVERWDRTPLGEQQTIIGRNKATGAPLGGKAERDTPDFAADPDGKVTPLDAHIRLANPRTAETAGNLILRRPFNYSRGLTNAGQLDMGLLFICFQSDLEAGFKALQTRLNGEPLEEYIKPVGGGYFFVMPGAASDRAYIGQHLLEGTA